MHAFINDFTRSIGTYLYGRRMYETMVYWETADAVPDEPPVFLNFAQIWQAADKVVYSTTLDQPASARTRIERTFDPEAIRRLKAESDRDLSVDGPGLAAQAIRAGLVDEYHSVRRAGHRRWRQPVLPRDVRVDLELMDERRFASGVVYLRYGVKDRA